MSRANEQIARAMEIMAMAMQLQNAYFSRMEAERAAASAARPTGSQESRDLAEFRKCHPPQFKGEANLEVDDHWICELEKIFTVLGCSQERRLAYAVYMLVGEAEHWWRGTHHMLTARGVVVDWECFRRMFLEKYFPECVRHAKEAEFMRLHQGGMIVSKYAMKFEHLARFYSQGIAEAWKCRKFAEGLKYDLKRVVGGGAALRCYRCGGSHMIRDCPHTENWCFRCQQMSHVSFNCPTGNRPERNTRRSDAQRGDAQRGDRPTAAGRVFALTGAEASTSSDLVKGKGRAADP
ncbi:uncharacterized protein LOC109809112 [Cajanus cajan]|uniref:uncharacterized protein LOC109809112 n=1 Tax=Cajanus cajan TaxID=3821 RepID=UPI00098DC9C0|nr:uncharacterized protein LOC109809112 [Cajanus cajan]